MGISNYNDVEVKVSDFIGKLNVKSFPIVAESIINHFKRNCILCKLPILGDVDVVTEYDPQNNVYVMAMNAERYTVQLMKRMNFSLGHELGHVVLEHKLHYANVFHDKQIYRYEREADYFSGMFLVPDNELIKLRHYSLQNLSKHFFVSEEVIKIRLENIKSKIPKQVKKSKDQLINEFFNIAKKNGYF